MGDFIATLQQGLSTATHSGGNDAGRTRRLLNLLVRSPSDTKRNWSTYSFIHSMKRNKINPKRAEDLVFVHTNLRLLSRQSSKYNEGETRMWDIGGDRAEPFDGAGTLEVSSLSLDEPELEAVIFILWIGE
ncbi:Dimer_Tnp_hAT domain-containing protein [Senna tora]|uniref:Dimer_Tnp_hAT domain-containing protein n=1 Tax=Senna tora TaxID=362788 RepID=A0A835CHJ6_9FABA|nr:Dimer_Tnp_hAT domain-containing protein [Senna tora]